MKTTRAGWVEEGIQGRARVATERPMRTPTARTARLVAGSRPERWRVGLSALALAGVLLGAAAVAGLATVSARVSTPTPPISGPGADPLRSPAALLCCQETP